MWRAVLGIRSEINLLLEKARADKAMGASLEAKVGAGRHCTLVLSNPCHNLGMHCMGYAAILEGSPHPCLACHPGVATHPRLAPTWASNLSICCCPFPTGAGARGQP